MRPTIRTFSELNAWRRRRPSVQGKWQGRKTLPQQATSSQQAWNDRGSAGTSPFRSESGLPLLSRHELRGLQGHRLELGKKLVELLAGADGIAKQVAAADDAYDAAIAHDGQAVNATHDKE